jgi:hypothetical protein
MILATTGVHNFSLAKELSCPKCEATFKLYDPLNSKYYSCNKCQAYLMLSDKEVKSVGSTKAAQLKPVIEIGKEGKLKDISFKVLAYFEKQEGNSDYKWREYLLTNPEKGYAFLSEYDGHWNLIWGKNFLPKLESPLDGIDYVMYENVEYKLFHSYTPNVMAIRGEINWHIFEDKLNVREFIAPPYIIIKETLANDPKQKAYFLGEYLEPETIAEGFGLDVNSFPSTSGILANQPSKAHENFLVAIKYFPILLLALLGLQLLVNIIKPSKILSESTYHINYTPDKGVYEFEPFKTASFNVEDVSSSLELEIYSEVNNNWLETSIVLVNEQNNQTWEVTEAVEFYQGVEGGEGWKEGSKQVEILLSEIPRGRYHLNVYPSSGDPYRDSLYIKVTANVTLWRNILVCMLLLTVYPVLLFYMMQRFEKKRWMNSNYSPYES